jgi:hypothetical protein
MRRLGGPVEITAIRQRLPHAVFDPAKSILDSGYPFRTLKK